MSVPNVFANGVGNVPDATLLNANFDYLTGSPTFSGTPICTGGLTVTGVLTASSAINAYDRIYFKTDASSFVMSLSQSVSIAVKNAGITFTGSSTFVNDLTCSTTLLVTGVLSASTAINLSDTLYFKTDATAFIKSLSQSVSIAVKNAGMTFTGISTFSTDVTVSGALTSTGILSASTAFQLSDTLYFKTDATAFIKSLSQSVSIAVKNAGISFVGVLNSDQNTANGSVATAMSSVGPASAHTAIQEWLKITLAGNVRYIPCW